MKKQKKTESWIKAFRKIYDSAIEKFDNGITDVHEMFTSEEQEFLASIGCRPHELFDFVEDWCEAGEPSGETVVAITAIRRDYFLQEQNGVWSEETIPMSSLPSMGASLGGYSWLPRIISKAKAKLQGEMPPELMYGCGGDRPFLRKVEIDAGDFLKLVWNSNHDVEKILEAVQQKAAPTE